MAYNIASIFAELEKGNGLPFWDLVKNALAEFKCQCSGPQGKVIGLEPLLSIACGDGEPVKDSVEELEAHYEKLAKDSSFADTFTIRARCVCVLANILTPEPRLTWLTSDWKVRPKDRFTGELGRCF